MYCEKTMRIILIKVNGVERELPYVDGNPDFSGVTEPSLSLLMAAWINGDYEIIEIEAPNLEIPEVET